VARQRVEIGIDRPEGAPTPVILNTGQIEAISGNQDGPFHLDGYLYDPSAYSWPRPRAASACGAPFLAVRGCGCGVKRVRQHCDKRGCSEEYCRGKIRSRRARKIKRRLDAGRTDGRAVLYTVLTVPPSRRGAAADKKTWKAWLDRIIRFMKKELALDYAVERTDPCGEDGEKWHPHINLLWVRRNGFRGFLRPEQLAALKGKWAAIVYGAKEAAGKPISVYHAYSTDEARILHWCSYMGRTWSRWEEEFPYHLRIKWLGKAPRTPAKEKDGPCQKCGKEVCRMQFGSEQAASDAQGWTYERLLDEAEEQRFQRASKFGKWKPINSAAELP
jgi:hypothetical protein